MAQPTLAKLSLKAKEQLGILTDLSTMLKAGIPILEAIESLESDAKANQRKVLRELHQALDNGEPLSSAMERLPNAFQPITVNLVRAAEAGGTLEDTLHDIVVSTKKEIAFNDQLRNTMIYPAFVMVVFVGIVVLMLTFVIPRVAVVFSNMRVHMPPVTKAMFAASRFFLAHWILISAAFIAFLFILFMVFKANKRRVVRWLLTLPVLKTLGNNIDLTRFTRSFGLLMRAGVPVVDALDLSERVVQKKQMREVVARMKADVMEGEPLSASLRSAHGIIPPIMARSIETAETSGTLDETLQNLTEHFDDEVTQSLKVISSLVEPVLLVVVGVMVGTLMITIIAPIYNLISQINPKK